MIHPHWRSRNIGLFLEDQVYDYNVRKIEDFSEEDLFEFAGLLIEAAGPEGEHEHLVESKNMDQIIGYLKMSLINGNLIKGNLCKTVSQDLELSKILKQNAVDYYYDAMQELLADYLQQADESNQRRDGYDDRNEAYE